MRASKKLAQQTVKDLAHISRICNRASLFNAAARLRELSELWQSEIAKAPHNLNDPRIPKFTTSKK